MRKEGYDAWEHEQKPVGWRRVWVSGVHHRRDLSDHLGYVDVNEISAHAEEFHEIFGVHLCTYWEKFTGFRVHIFDRDFVKSEFEESVSESILRQWGERAQELVHELTGAAPLLERLEAIRVEEESKRRPAEV